MIVNLIAYSGQLPSKCGTTQRLSSHAVQHFEIFALLFQKPLMDMHCLAREYKARLKGAEAVTLERGRKFLYWWK